MTWKHEYMVLKYCWNLNISEILQGVLHVNNILELLLKYHFDTFMTSLKFNISRIKSNQFNFICEILFNENEISFWNY